jgi:lipid II isoglutaminyl synthase (glutamine-hydrolysing)
VTEVGRYGDEAAPEGADQQWQVVQGPSHIHKPSLRTTLAVDIGRLAAVVSRRLRMGSGGMIGGRLALTLQPKALHHLVTGRRVVMVTGTNGKTTTTQMVAEALRSRGEAVSNATGANMLDGHVAALMTQLHAPYAALEVDELHLAQVTSQFEPAVIILLNLSRDQLDRVGEIRSVEQSIRLALWRAPGTHVVANRDDPNIVSAAADHERVTWVSGGSRWKHDALNCPRCGAFIEDIDRNWRCACGLSRPEADWTVTESGLIGPDGEHLELALSLPGHVNRINAAFALAAALRLGCDHDAVLRRVAGIEQAGGRYGNVELAGRTVRLLLAKNPASWLEMLDLVSGHERPLILVVNSREADGYDVSWLWDIDFGCLRGRVVTVAGDRALDLAVRLRYAEVRCEVADRVEAALDQGVDGTPEVIANYTAFRDLFAKSTRR